MPLQKLLSEAPRLVELLADESDALLLRRVLELLVLQRDPLTPASMAALLGAECYKIDGILGALQPALATDDREVVLLKDTGLAVYLTDSRRCTDKRFAIDKTSTDLGIAIFCLELLSSELHSNMCLFRNSFEASRRMADMSSYEREELRSRIPAHIVYAARFWVTHVCEVDSESVAAVGRHAAWPKVRSCIESFAKTATVFWIEVLAAVGALNTLQIAASRLTPLLPDSIDVLALFTEAATLLDRFPDFGRGTPASVYITVMPRLPQDSAMRRLLGASAVLPFPIAVAQRPPAFEFMTLSHTLVGHSRSVVSVMFSGDSCTLASGADDKTIKLWDVATGQLLRTLEGHSEGVSSIAFSSAGHTLVSGSFDGTIKLWDATTGQQLRTIEEYSKGVYAVAFSSDGHSLVSGSPDTTVKLWEAATGRQLLVLQGHSKTVSSVAFSSDGRTLASGSWDKTVKLWEMATGQLLWTLEGHTDFINSVAFNGDSCTLASGSYDKTIKLWDVATGQMLRTLNGHNFTVYSVAFSGDSLTLASASTDKTIKLWEVESGQLLRTLKGHRQTARSVAFSSDGRTLASGSFDKSIKLWDVATGQLLRTLEGHSEGVQLVGISRDDCTLASGSDGKRIKLSRTAS